MSLTRGNQITLLRNGTEYFPALEQAISQASKEIQLQSYIFEADTTGIRIASALKQAARRGVAVCLLLDGFGCNQTPVEFFNAMRDAGVHVLIYRPAISPWSFKRNRLRRLHRKVAVIDGHTAFVGGINIIDDMNTPSHVPPRIDYAVQIHGPLAATINNGARRLWRRIAWRSLRVETPVLPTLKRPASAGNLRAKFIVRDNALHRRDIENAYLDAIEAARSEIIIANAYFLPGLRFRRALSKAAKRGVRVVLLLQERVEFWLLDHATKALYGSLLEAGIEIHEYQKSQMHSKVAVIDGRWLTVGSSNIDPFSLWLAHEANIVVDDAGFAALLRDDLQQALQSGARQLPTSWKHKSLLYRCMMWVSYGVVRLMMGIVGINDNAS